MKIEECMSETVLYTYRFYDRTVVHHLTKIHHRHMSMLQSPQGHGWQHIRWWQLFLSVRQSRFLALIRQQ